MGFKLRKRQNWLFLPLILFEIGLGYMLTWLNIHPLLLGGILIFIALVLTAWILKGNAIFHLRFYRSHRIVEIHEIKVPEELQEKVFGKPKIEGRILPIKNHIVKRKIRKKRFEL